MLETPRRIIGIMARLLTSGWLIFMGCIASLMLYNEIFDPEWGRQAKDRFPVAPPWYILALVAAGALVCFFLAFKLLASMANKEQDRAK